MSGVRIGTNSFDIDINGLPINVETMSLDITDNTATAFSNGRPDGYIYGDVAASGEIVVSVKSFKIFVALAAKSGSWQDMPAVDISAIAGAGVIENSKITAYGCKLKFTKILDVDPKKVELATRTIPFEVTDQKFVEIDGIPYVKSDLAAAVGGAIGGIAGNALGGLI